MPRRGYDRQLSAFPQQHGCPSTCVGPEKNQEGQAAAEAVDTTVFLLGRQREETGAAEGQRRPRQGIFWRLDELISRHCNRAVATQELNVQSREEGWVHCKFCQDDLGSSPAGVTPQENTRDGFSQIFLAFASSNSQLH